jgi:prolyl-tRNA editing enzyme YbaK/EbsC (Cys-tRNA(Pro) deacylase)
VVTPETIYRFGEEAGVTFLRLSHGAEGRSAQVRTLRASSGFDDTVGAKALLCKSKSRFFLCVIPGHRLLNSPAVKARMGAFRFATPAEFHHQTGGLIFGTLPPFVAPVLPLLDCILVDPILRDAPCLAFNAASLTMSFFMSGDHYVKLLSYMQGSVNWLPMSIEKS